jgi:endoglucanase
MSAMRLLLALLLILGLAAPVAAEPLVHVEGKAFIAPDGRPLNIKGINLGNWLVPEGYIFKLQSVRSPQALFDTFDRLLGAERAARFWTQFRDTYITRDDIRFIKSAGFNTVRIPLHYRLFMTDQGEITGEGWFLLDRVLGWMREAGLFAIVDLHAAPGGQGGVSHDDGSGYPLMFYVPRNRQLTVKLWRAIAQRYSGDPVILGYDLLNEPIAPYHDTPVLNARLEPFYKEVTQAIREVDPGRIVILGGGQWNQRFDMMGPPFTANLAYAFHHFWSNTTRDAIQRYVNFANRYNVPLILGETGELTDEWNERFRKLNEKNGIGWAFWTYKNLDTPSTVVSIPRPDGWSEIVAFADGTRKDKPAAAVIDRAIAQYLDGIKFKNGEIRWSYLASLGLKAAP